jgi:hypothetical protein
MAAVRVQFRNSERHRDYVIGYDHPWLNQYAKRTGKLACESAAWGAGRAGLDLRDPKNVAAVERFLQRTAAELLGEVKIAG